jgi:hypothetical protein
MKSRTRPAIGGNRLRLCLVWPCNLLLQVPQKVAQPARLKQPHAGGLEGTFARLETTAPLSEKPPLIPHKLVTVGIPIEFLPSAFS